MRRRSIANKVARLLREEVAEAWADLARVCDTAGAAG